MGERGRNATGKRAVTRKPVECKPPADLSEDAKVIWCDIVQDFPPDYFQPKHFKLLSVYVEAAARHTEACRQLDKSGLVVVNEVTGNIKKNPLLGIIDSEASKMATLCTKLNLNVTSKVNTTKAYRPPSRLSGLINQGLNDPPAQEPRREDLIFRG